MRALNRCGGSFNRVLSRAYLHPSCTANATTGRSADLDCSASDAGVRAWLTGAPLPDGRSPGAPAITLDRGIAAAFARARRGTDCDGGRGGGGELPKTVRLVAGGRCADDIRLERRVEHAWKNGGVQVVITPGRRATGRDVAGELAAVDRLMLTGDLSDAGNAISSVTSIASPRSAIPRNASWMGSSSGRVRGGRVSSRCIVSIFCGRWIRASKTLQAATSVEPRSLSECAVRNSTRARARHTAGEPGAPGDPVRHAPTRLARALARSSALRTSGVHHRPGPFR